MSKEGIFRKNKVHSIDPFEVFERMEKSMDEYTKEMSIEFFKWNRNNYSSQPNEEELEERYQLFLKETT